MKKIILFLITLLLSISVYAQKDILVKSYYDNGNVKEVLSFNENNQLDGTCLAYSSEGIQIGLASYENGVKDGEWKIWREDGTLAYEMYYEKGNKIGVWKVYDNQGNLIKERDFN